jgi:hypothetical protein
MLALPRFHRKYGDLQPRTSHVKLCVRMDGFNTHALVIVLRIIHGESNWVPQRVSVDELSDIARVVDYMECHEAVHAWYRIWKGGLYGILKVMWSATLQPALHLPRFPRRG